MHSSVTTLAFSLAWLLYASFVSSEDPKALVIPPSQYFEGNDGPWSSFNVRVGTPEQVVRVLISTASPESLVVLSDGGCSTSAFSGTAVPSNCAVSRGIPFNPDKSSTWNEVGTYGINGDGVGLEANLGYSVNAKFALETLGIGLTGPSLKNQTVAGIATAEPFYLGIFGLNNLPVNFSSLGNYSAPSFLTTLKDRGAIPSLSWSYTAGAQYRLKQVYGQLIFSGYDKSRFDSGNSVSFTMAGDVTRDLVVVLQSISYSGSDEATLLSDPIDIFIDSTDPNLWLPESVCESFEKAFGLTLDQKSGLYLVNDTHHTKLLNSDAEVSFRLSDVRSGGETVTITLPYESFALNARPPLVENNSHYFPLKRAANATQYTLGRTFLQEAYLTADYERGTFNVSACAWNAGAKEDIVTVFSKDGPSSDGGSSSSNTSHLGPGSIAGIVIGCVAFVALFGIILALVIRRRNLTITYAARDPVPDEAVMSGPIFNFDSRNFSSGAATRSTPSGAGATGVGSNSPDSNGVVPNVKGGSETTGSAPGLAELPGESGNPENGDATVVHELPGTTVAGPTARGQEDAVSTVGNLPFHISRDEEVEEPSSPFVSTIGTTGMRDLTGDDASYTVSPSSPVHPRSAS